MMAEDYDDDFVPIGSSVSKRFFVNGQEYCEWFKGKVISYNNRTGLYKVVYDDGDSEDCSIDELKTILVASSSTRENHTAAAAAATTTATTTTDSVAPSSAAVVVVAAAAAAADHRTTIKEEIEEEWIPIGSKVRAQWKVGSKLKWFRGKVTSYNEKSHQYNVEYEDGDKEQCTFEELKPYLVSSHLRSKPKGNTSCSAKMAPTTTKKYGNETSDKNEQTIPIGSMVRNRFKVGSRMKWFNGKITSYNKSTGRYIVLYDDGDCEQYTIEEVKLILVSTTLSSPSPSTTEDHEQDQRVWKFRRIVSHEGPLNNKHPNWRGSNYNVMIEWENGEVTREPLSMIAADDPVTCAIYAKDNDLLQQTGWKRFKRIAKRHKKMFRMANQAKLQPCLGQTL